MNDQPLTINDLCTELGIGKNTAYKLTTQTHQIKSAKVGQRILITRNALDEYISNKIDGKKYSSQKSVHSLLRLWTANAPYLSVTTMPP